MKKITLFLCVIFLMTLGYSQGSETFANLVNATGDGNGMNSSYQGWTWTGDNGAEWTATDARTDQTLNGSAILIRNGEMSTTILGGIGDLTLTTKRNFSGSTGDITVSVNGTVAGTIPYDDTEQTHTISGIDISGDVTLLLETAGNGDRVVMDDLIWTEAAGSGADVGTVCEAAIPITTLPYLTTDNTENYGNNYGSSDRPTLAAGAIGNPSSSYLSGDDVVYAYTPSADGFVDITVTEHGAWAGVFVFTGCPFDSTVGGHTNSSATTDLEVIGLPVQTGVTYYILISTYASPQTTPYALSVTETAFDCPALNANIGDACDDGDNTTANDSINASCECEGEPTTPGEICNNPIEVTQLPFTTTDNTENYGNHYGSADRPAIAEGAIGNPSASYLSGDDVVYAYTPIENETINISVTEHGTYTGVFVFTGCAFESTVGGHTNSSGTTDLNVNLLPVQAGVTYYIVISTWASPQTTPYTLTITANEFDCPLIEANIGDACDDGDPDTINDVVNEDCDCEGILPPDGMVCEAAIEVTALPYITTDNTENYGDNYSSSDFPALAADAIGSPSSNYLNGDDVVYAYTPSTDGIINISVTEHGAWAGVFVFTGCPFESTVGGHTVSSGTVALEVNQLPVVAGVTYYIVISTYASPQTTPYTLSISEFAFDCPALEANIGDACDDGDADTINDVIDADCNCIGELPAIGSVCESAMELICNEDPITVSSASSNGTNTTDCTMGDNGLWFSFMGTGGDITINSSATFDHEMSINSGSCDTMVNLGCKDSYTGDETYTISASVDGDMYFVYIAQYASGSVVTGDITISLTCVDLDCPVLGGNIGDTCDLGGENGVIDEDCECVEITCENNSKYPSSAVIANADGSDTTISTCNYWSEYSEIGSIISGYEYIFDSVKNGVSAYVTVREGSVGGPVVASGYGPLTITANSNDNLFVHWNEDADCGTSSGCAVSTVSCVTCAEALDCEGVIGGPAQPGTACDDGDADTINDVYDADCNCAGELPAAGSVCDSAIELICNEAPITVSSAASNGTNTTDCAMGDNGLWFSFMGTGGDITINSSATFDHEMSINSGSCDTMVNLGCKDSSTGAETYTITSSVAGDMYYVYIARYNTGSNVTGDITISLDCATPPACIAPSLDLAVQDANGDPIVDCLEPMSEYFVLATLSGGDGNTSYDVSANSGTATQVNADDSVVLGPFIAGNDVSVNAVGVQDTDCFVTTTINSPALCPPSNDSCDDAIVLECNAAAATYSSVGSTATNTTACTMGSNGIWFSFMGNGGDIVVNSSATFDHEMSINSGSCGTMVNIACKDATTGAETYTITDSVDGEMYYVYIANWSGSSTTTGNITINITCEALSIDDNNMLAGTRLFPNPLNDGTFFIHAPKLNGEQVEVNITDMSGRQVFSNTLSVNDNKATVSVNDTLSSGMYLVTLKHAGESNTYRLIKE